MVRELKAIARSREAAHAAHRDRVRERAKRAAEGEAARPTPYRRSEECRLKVFPWVATDLEELAVVRAVAPSRLGSAILEAVVDIWIRNPWDHELFLARCEDPQQAHQVVSVPEGPTTFISAANTWDERTLRLFGAAAIRCLEAGISVDDLARELRELATVLVEEAG